jgi:hypothetical protein
MALVTVASDASLDADSAMRTPHVLAGDLFAGEALLACAPCYIKQSDGKVYMSNGTAATEPAGFDGFTPKAYAVGDAVALYGIGVMMRYSNGALTPGQKLYIAATAGRLDTTATTGDAVGVARAINASDIRVTRAV